MTSQKKLHITSGVAAALALAWLLFYPSERDRLDAEAKRLCAIDGGTKVFEAVTLPADKFTESGNPRISRKDEQGLGYYETYKYTNLKKDFELPTLIRHEYQVIRSADKKVIASHVLYRRSGGSWWDGLIEGDGFVCPSDNVNTAYKRQVFQRGASK